MGPGPFPLLTHSLIHSLSPRGILPCYRFCLSLPICSYKFMVISADICKYFSSQNEVYLSAFPLTLYSMDLFSGHNGQIYRHSSVLFSITFGELLSFVESGLCQHHLCCFQFSVIHFLATNVLIKAGLNLKEFTYFYLVLMGEF